MEFHADSNDEHPVNKNTEENKTAFVIDECIITPYS
jgi:hypothetical protein